MHSSDGILGNSISPDDGGGIIRRQGCCCRYGEGDQHPTQPLHTSGQIDGLESVQAALVLNDGHKSLQPKGSNLQLRLPSPVAEIAIAALQYLPMPVIVLNSLKTVVLANESICRLLGVGAEDAEGDEYVDGGLPVTERLKGKTLSQLGIDLLQDGRYAHLIYHLSSFDIPLG
jgi:PAS domain-containing protein